ncbi:MAG: glycosyltransferase family 39 protein [Candidatus Coatesbacteria bacterium]|nr:MAG: glycosyltransferase family 39 protein [Candidatus Coatesbacteria bacterium]
MRKLHTAVAAIVIVGVVGASFAAYFYYHPEEKGWLDFVSFLGHVFLFAALTWAAYFSGRLLARTLFRQRESYWEVELALGWIAFGLAAYLLAAVRLLYPWVVRGLVLAVLALSAPLLKRTLEGAGEFFRERWSKLGLGAALVLGAVAPLAFAYFVRVGVPPFEWDSLVYHLYLPKAYAEAHGFVYLPRLVYSSMPLGAEMIFLWAYLWNGLGCAGAVAPVLNFVMAVAAWRLARRYLDNLWATAAAVFLFVTPAYLAYFPSAYVDMMVGAFALLALILYLRGFESRSDAALAGLFLGAAMGVKYTAVYAAIGMAPLLLWDLSRRRLRPSYLVLFVSAAALMVVPWLAKAFVERGNPVFPALYGWFGGRDLSPVVAEHLLRWQKGIGMGREPLDYLLIPYRISVEAAGGYEKFDGIMLPFAVAALAWAALWFRRGRLIVYSALYIVAWAFIASQQLRFLSAAFATLAVLSAGCFAFLADRFRGGVRAAVSVALIGAVLVFGYVVNGPTVFFYTTEAIKYVVSRDADSYLKSMAPPYPVNKYINESLPAEAVILMIFDDHLLYLERPAVYDSFFEASETLNHVAGLNNPAEVADYVDELGATHILTGKFAISYFWSHYEPHTRALWEEYLRGYTTRIYDDREFELRAVLPR